MESPQPDALDYVSQYVALRPESVHDDIHQQEMREQETILLSGPDGGRGGRSLRLPRMLSALVVAVAGTIGTW
jgi:hypothetical protein